MSKKKTFKVTMEFEDEDLAHDFFTYLSDCGGEQGCSWEDEGGVRRGIEFDYWGGEERKGYKHPDGSNFLGNKKVIVTRGDWETD